MERVNFDYPISFRGYETGFIDDVIDEKNRIIDIQEKDGSITNLGEKFKKENK